MELPPGLANGDSGGGAVSKRDGSWFLAGLVSVAVNDGKLYGFTNVKPHLEWLARILNTPSLGSGRVYY